MSGVVWQKEHSNLITNLRATNEPAMSVGGDRVPMITETRDIELVTGGQTVGMSSSIRQRRKIERNTSAPLPGMLQVNNWCELFSVCSCYISLSVSFIVSCEMESRDLTSHLTHYRPFQERLLQARWPNQQCQSTEGNQLVIKDQAWIPPEPLHHVTVIQL